MGIKIVAVALIILGLNMVGMGFPSIIVGILLIIGGVGVLAGF